MTSMNAAEQTSPNSTQKQRQASSVWDFESVCFEVESEIFTVIKKDLLAPGSVFADMFQVASAGQPPEGKDSNNPIVLNGIKARHFHVFCSVLYPWANGCAQIGEQDEDTLLGVLHLANMWHFPKIREQAIKILSDNFVRSRTSPEKIRLGEKYLVQQWALDGYATLVKRRGLLFGELEKEPYNFDDTVTKKVLYLQLNYGPGREHSCGAFHCTGYEARHDEIERAVKELLSDELARALYVTEGYTL